MRTEKVMGAYFERTKEERQKIMREVHIEPNPALKMYEKARLRPYCKEDFVRKEFHMNLIAQE
ncbi:MAG: hypothetical protein LIP04_16345 [Tannerellaceae bacterium]|nr:hypothetical protein [Tannerellaceae bacterium]